MIQVAFPFEHCESVLVQSVYGMLYLGPDDLCCSHIAIDTSELSSPASHGVDDEAGASQGHTESW